VKNDGVQMKYFRILILCLTFSMVSVAQTDSSFYFPMGIGDLWQCKEPPPPIDPYTTEYRTGKDTMFSNGQTYRILYVNAYGYPDTAISAYRRQIGNKVYQYFSSFQGEGLVYDFSKNKGDTVSIFSRGGGDTSIVTVLDLGMQNIFGKERRYITFYDRTFSGTLFWIDQITDSIGITFSQIEPGYQLYLVGAIIDSTRYGIVTGVNVKQTVIPKNFMLFQNFPNPFNPSTTIKVQLLRGDFFTLSIYNVLGEQIRMLYEGKATGDIQNIAWDGKNKSGIQASSGVYFYRITSGSLSVTKKMMNIQ
jgi:Secretion system C-terminal sorting domain